MPRDPYRNFSTYKIDPLTEIRNLGIVTAGDVFWVSSPSDSDHTDRVDQLGRGVVKVSGQAAVDVCSNDQNDYVLFVPSDANAVFGLGTALDVNKDRVHMFGLGANKAKNSYSVTIRTNMGTTQDTELVNVTGDGVELGGLRFLGTLGTHAGGTMSNGVLFVQGHDLWVHDCVVEDSTNIWGTPPVVRGGGTAAHDARFDDCYFALTGTGNVESAGNSPMVVGGDGNKRWLFNRCYWRMPAGSVTETFFSPGTGAKETTVLRDCHFGLINGTTHAITSAIRGSTTANNPVLCINCTGLSVTQIGTDPNVYKTPVQSGTRAVTYDQGLAVGTAMLIAA